jgi:hypothetical protein
MKFCDKCDSKIIETTDGSKCPKCDDLSQIPKKHLIRNKIGVLSKDSFPFEKNLYYKAPSIRNALCCDKQSGISHNEDYDFLTLLRYAHKHDPNARNPYLDWYDEKSGNYYYVGKGVNGDQSLTGVNEKLANAKETGTKIHLFWQHAINSDHQYIGQMNMQTYDQKTQPGSNKIIRKDYVFTLNLI